MWLCCPWLREGDYRATTLTSQNPPELSDLLKAPSTVSVEVGQPCPAAAVQTHQHFWLRVSASSPRSPPENQASVMAEAISNLPFLPFLSFSFSYPLILHCIPYKLKSNKYAFWSSPPLTGDQAICVQVRRLPRDHTGCVCPTALNFPSGTNVINNDSGRERKGRDCQLC